MVDPVTPNRNIPVQAHGANVNTWDVPLNSGLSIIDSSFGAIASISTTGGTTVLNAAQLACGTISVTGALSSTAAIVFSGGGSSVQGWWTIENRTTGNFAMVALTNGTENIGIPPGGLQDIQVNGGTVRLRNLPMVGSYMDVAADIIPLWIQASTKPPFLFCNGATFSGATYPQLADFLGSTTLPDFRGRAPYYMNIGTGRLTLAGAGINGDQPFASGGTNGVTLSASQIPTLNSSGSNNISVTNTGTNPYRGTSAINSQTTFGGGQQGLFANAGDVANSPMISTNAAQAISVTYTNASQQIVGIAAPGVMSGIRLIRAA